MSWPVHFETDRISLHVTGRISEADASRQTRTAQAILERLRHQPGLILDDDPVPDAIAKLLKRGRVDLGDLRERLRELPLRSSKHIKPRLSAVRRSLAEALAGIWQEALVQARFRSPLLILDEAHHLKNPSTRLASLFVDPEAEQDSRVLQGALHGGFERMLFLTATPFELGHHELLNVVDRFAGVGWQPGSPTRTRDEFAAARSELGRALDEAHGASHRLDQCWARLRPEHVTVKTETEEALQDWWQHVSANPNEAPDAVQTALRAHRAAAGCMRGAEDLLRPWIIRHGRPATLPGSTQLRRIQHRGAAISPDGRADAGLEIREEALLPFLLAARTQAVIAHRDGATASASIRRATFAEGLASSYEAFLETRAMRHDASLEPATLCDEDPGGSLPVVAPPSAGHVRWYLDKLRAAIPSDNAYEHHPKVLPTVQRACELWEHGEKTLIFCHWRATGTALARHLASEIERRIERIGARKLGCPQREVSDRLRLLGGRFDTDGPLYRELDRVVHDLVHGRKELGEEETQKIVFVMQRFLRTPAFLVRFFPLEIEDPITALTTALHEQDASGLNLRAKLESFVDFLAGHCEPELRGAYLDALGEIRTGIRKGGRSPDDAGDDAFDLQPPVRRATGADDAEQRRRTLLCFNTPFFPEILVASSVLAEGVDLHLDCRHVVHHDLGWNPSHLEQRTGRVDRIGSKAERVRQPIHIYLPYVAETQDEKMYRVVRDRERWFQVLMGGGYDPDETLTDRLSARVPLPEGAAQELVFRLEVAR